MRAQEKRTDTTHERSVSRRLPRSTSAAGLLGLQGAAGNAAVTRAIHARRLELAHAPHVQRPAVQNVLLSTARPLVATIGTEMRTRFGRTDLSNAGDAAVVQMIGQAGQAPDMHRHSAGCGHREVGQPTVQRSAVHEVHTDNGSGLRVSDPSEPHAGGATSGAAVSGAKESAASAPGSQAGMQTVQRYYQDDEFRIRHTRDNQYAVDGMSEDYRSRVLWVRERARGPRYCVPVNGRHRTMLDGVYRAYVPSTQFYADCVQTAEDIMHNAPRELGNEDSQFRGTGQVFGRDEEGNITGALEYDRKRRGRGKPRGRGNPNLHERPSLGQAYAMVETNYRDDVDKDGDIVLDENGRPRRVPNNKSHYPYHAAAVVAEDGEDQVTLEETAGDAHAERRDQAGWFSLYRVGDEELSFFGQQKNQFSKGAVAVVIEARL
ncbi:hypothetical protein [Pseudonocardia alaniniphila]|uniref:Uncharacterized protein n=1 Tax=Pseudonocardia alaniniphila TaxID=75291 RepID=A0ABS9TTT5_9PSEU|nr:hypothetical protein [Pseudonocardia alaniniphila]MCH6171977.1 hypothetical protein [Pseudonocardia alaniniphila]